ncbi:protein SPMIP1-like [Babylonia areolata]|uniref:protein SPMIP1-like n=1 Tax=Babylonia areolata TaxID=304850 RepID=UPI003FD450DC
MSSARNANFTTQYSDFLKESYEKESNQRLAWFAKRRNQAKTKPRQLEVFRKKITEGSQPSEALLSRLPEIDVEPRHHRRKADFNDPHVENLPEVDVQPWMRPASPETWKSLFEGFTKEETGRYQYLRRRNKIIPEEKFAYPILTSWDYGWRLGDSMTKENIKKPKYGRTHLVQDTFYTRNGIDM